MTMKRKDKEKLANKVISLMGKGLSLQDAADKLGRGKQTMLDAVNVSQEMRNRYDNAQYSKGVLYADEMIQVIRDLPDDPTHGQLKKAELLSGKLQFAATRFWQHLKDTPPTGPQVNINVEQQPQYALKVAEPVPKSALPVANTTVSIPDKTEPDSVDV